MRRAGLLNDSSLPFTVHCDEKLLFIFEPGFVFMLQSVISGKLVFSGKAARDITVGIKICE